MVNTFDMSQTGSFVFLGLIVYAFLLSCSAITFTVLFTSSKYSIGSSYSTERICHVTNSVIQNQPLTSNWRPLFEVSVFNDEQIEFSGKAALVSRGIWYSQKEQAEQELENYILNSEHICYYESTIVDFTSPDNINERNSITIDSESATIRECYIIFLILSIVSFILLVFGSIIIFICALIHSLS